MSFLEWMRASMFIDVAFIIFAAATIWKFRKQSLLINELRGDLTLTIKNPQSAKRKLKQRQK